MMLINQDPQWSEDGTPDFHMFTESQSLDENSTLFPDDLLQALSSELDFPLSLEDETSFSLCDETLDEKSLNGSLRDTSVLSFNNSTNNEEIRDRMREIKLESHSPISYLNPPLSPNSSESNQCEWQQETLNPGCLDNRFVIETPPISPPQDITPPTSPQVSSNPLSQAKLISVGVQDAKFPQYVFAKTNLAKRLRIQSNAEKHKDLVGKTIVLNSQDFSALTNKFKQKNTPHDLKIHLSPKKPTKVQNPIKVEVPEENVIQLLPQKPVKLVGVIPHFSNQGNGKSLHLPNTTPLILDNNVTGCPSSAKNESLRCASIAINKEILPCTPIIIKKELHEFTNSSGRQELEIKALKRQQRMIKNRESACLSRKKKKEYVTSLEMKISDLQEEIKQLKLENAYLKHRLSATDNNNSNKTNTKYGKMDFNMNKKNAAILLGVFFMVSLNINFGTTLLREERLETVPNSIPQLNNVGKHGRTLLWANPDEDSFNNTNSMHESMYPKHINQSESIRLHYELDRWIKGDSHRQNMTGLKRKRPIINPLNKLSSFHRMKRKVSKFPESKKSEPVRSTNNNIVPENPNAVEIFSPTLRDQSSLFEALGRKDDTFYVVWFSSEHLLLPASRQNNSVRPKISLVLPIYETSLSTPEGHVSMMEIECDVKNTHLLQLQQSIIPEHLKDPIRSRRQSNRENDRFNNFNNNTTNFAHKYKPYFVNREKDTKKSIVQKNEVPSLTAN